MFYFSFAHVFGFDLASLSLSISGFSNKKERNPLSIQHSTEQSVRKMRRLFISALLVVAATALLVHADPHVIKPRFRKGALYQEVLEADRAYNARMNLGEPNCTVNWFSQPLYANQPNGETFQQRWYRDESGWAGIAPADRKLAALYLPGEGPADCGMNGYARHWTKEYGFGVFTLENRWYGQSIPGGVKNAINKVLMMQTLSVDIALSDFSVFMTYIDKLYGKNFTWITIGGSYSGACSAWMRQTYPSQVTAAWSSSGVVHPIFDFHQYDGHVGEQLNQGCYDRIQAAYFEFEKLYDDPTTRQRVYEMLQIPSYFTKRDIAFALADQGAGMVQYSRKTKMCDFLDPLPKETPLANYVAMAQYYFGPMAFASCGYSTMCMTNKQYSGQWADAGLSWMWQTCSELAWWQVSSRWSLRQPNIVSTEYMIDQCRTVFARPDLISDTFTFNQKRGGVNVTGTDFVVAAQGSCDPWSTSGVRVSPRANYPVFISQAEDAGHCSDLMSPTPNDSDGVLHTRKMINATLRGWLGL